MEGECCPHSGGECGYEGIGFRLEHRSNDSCETTDVLGPTPEPIAGSVLSLLSALRCLVWNSRMLSGIPKLVGRTQGAFRLSLLCPYSAPPGNRRSLLLVGVAQDIGGPPAIGHGRVPYAAFVVSMRVGASNDFELFTLLTVIS